jgi:O-antigen ligase
MPELAIYKVRSQKSKVQGHFRLVGRGNFVLGQSMTRERIACWGNRFLFGSLLGLIVLVAIPYGTVEPWWIALYQIAVFALAAPAIASQALINNHGFGAPKLIELRLFLPVAALLAFVFLQSVSLPQWLSMKGSISSDPFETRLLFLQLLVLAANAYLLVIYTSNRRRLRLLVNAVIALAFASALFGIARLALQHSEFGFGLPLLRRDSGFGQFINKNHFAFLMEMGIGLGTGLLVAGGVKRERRLVYVTALVVMWAALVQTFSRGAVFSLLTQMVFLIAATIWLRARERDDAEPERGGWRLALLSGLRAIPRMTTLLRATLGLILVALIALGTVWLGGDLLVTRMESLSSELTAEAGDTTGETTSETNGATAPNAGVKRREVWAATWLLIRSSPIVGTGFGAYGVAITRFHNASGKWVPEAAHNDYLELLSAGGLIGATLVGWFVVCFVRSARHQLLSVDRFRRAACLAALTGLLGVMAHSVVDFGLHVTANAVVFLALIVMATKELPATEQEEFLHEANVG